MVARLLLIEDDASIARFVEFALEELPGFDVSAPAVKLTVVRQLSDARTALAAGGWQLVISDLMLPDGSAQALLDEGWPKRPEAPPWIVFSAGLHETLCRALSEHGVARTLRKPVPLTELLGTVCEFLVPASVPPDPVQQHFAGDKALFEAFRTGCIDRFADDLARGDRAVAEADMAALHRVAHGLKAVLELIGQPSLAAEARALEQASAAWEPGQPLPRGWGGIADGLVRLGACRAS